MAEVEAELVADRLFALGATAVSEGAAADGRVALVADVDPAALTDLGWQVRVLVDDPSLHTAWHASARAWRCGERLVVRPVWVEPWAGPDGEGLVEVLLDPGATFGSGSHPTTRRCLELLEPLAADADTVLDVGCGTGVLGVAALALGARSLVAIDIEPDAVAATLVAAHLNGVQDRARVDRTPLADVPGRYDLVLANLLVPIIEELGAELVAHLAPGGSMVVGGVLADQVDRAVRALAPLQVVDSLDDGDWVALTLHGGPTPPAAPAGGL